MKKIISNFKLKKINKKGLKILVRSFSLVMCMICMFCIFSGCNNDNSRTDNGSTANSKKTVKIGYLPITHAIPLYVEKERENSEIELVKFGSWPELMEALNSGKIDGASVLVELAMKAKSQGIDGYCVAEPFGAKSVAVNNGKVLKQSGEIIPNSICCSLVLRGDFIEKNRDEAKKVVNDYKKSCEYIAANEEEAKKMSKKFLNVSGNALDLSFGWIKFNKLKIEKDDYDLLSNYLLEMNLLDTQISYEDFVDNSLLEEVE